MTHLMVVDYPYHTVKRLFVSLDEAMSTRPKDISILNRVLGIRIYPIKSFVNETRYGLDIENGIYINPKIR